MQDFLDWVSCSSPNTMLCSAITVLDTFLRLHYSFISLESSRIKDEGKNKSGGSSQWRAHGGAVSGAVEALMLGAFSFEGGPVGLPVLDALGEVGINIGWALHFYGLEAQSQVAEFRVVFLEFFFPAL